MPQKSRVASAIGLFFLSPLIAKFLLGNLPIKMLPALIILAPMYGGGALLIREVARRTGRGWPSILVLGLVYGIVEEAFITQSLFNPNYLSLNQHLLEPGYIPALGIGAWWTLFVLTLHTAWSICTSIALMEALAPSKAIEPWLGRGRAGSHDNALHLGSNRLHSYPIGSNRLHSYPIPAGSLSGWTGGTGMGGNLPVAWWAAIAA